MLNSRVCLPWIHLSLKHDVCGKQNSHSHFSDAWKRRQFILPLFLAGAKTEGCLGYGILGKLQASTGTEGESTMPSPEVSKVLHVERLRFLRIWG